MVQSITPAQIREHNKNRIYELIYKQGHKGISQQEISSALNISRPTVAYNLRELHKEGLIIHENLQTEQSQTAGRKPIIWAANSDHKIAIGVEILRETVKIIAINLYAEKINREVIKIEFKNDESYFKYISERVKKFIESLTLKQAAKKILGIGFALQGLVSEDGQTVIYGEILKCTGLKIEVFTKWLDYPCMFVHEPDGAALSELWVSPELRDAIYLSMSVHLGGAVIRDRKVMNGIHRHSATFEHIRAKDEDGDLCYCGLRGCVETVCSMTALIGEGKNPDKFFERVRANKPKESKRWKIFLEYLARLITNLHLIIDTKYILGGHLAPYFTDKDVKFLYDKIRENTPFIESDDFILISKMPSHNITIGAALPYIMKFLKTFGFSN